jgi:Protein of unknown function (DUF1353)
MGKTAPPFMSALRKALIHKLTSTPINEVIQYAFLMKHGREFTPRTRGHGSGIVLIDDTLHPVSWHSESPDIEALGVPLKAMERYTSTNEMSRFIGQLVVRAIPQWESGIKRVQMFEVMQPFGFHSDKHGMIIVPAGFITDFASVPKMAKWFVDDDDPDILLGSLPHDLLYTKQGKLDDGRQLTRYDCDCVLREAMLCCGAPRYKVNIVFAAVRVGGGSHWG